MSKILQHWECFVEEVKRKYFWARAIDVAGIEPELNMKIAIKEVKEEDKHLLKRGYYFDLIIQDDPEEVILKFKPVVKITPEEKAEAEKLADEMMDIFEKNDKEK